MDKQIRRDDNEEGRDRQTSARGHEPAHNDDVLLLFPFSDAEPRSLTKREREERWPIG